MTRPGWPWDDDELDDVGVRPDDPAQPGAPPVARPDAWGEVPETAPAAAEAAGRPVRAPARGEARVRTATRSSPRRRASSADDARYALASRLTERDRALLHAVARHGLFTTDQLAAMFFDSVPRARVRLVALWRLRLLDRFRPHRAAWGAEPYHYVLGPAGAGVLAAERGDDPAVAQRRWNRGRTLALAGSQRLAHIVGVSGFYAALVAEARRNPDAALARWRTEAEAAAWAGGGRWSGGTVNPDGWGVWREGALEVEFFVEYDRGSESLPVLASKLRGYREWEAERGAAAWVLFAFLSPRREGNARQALRDADVAVATAALVGPARPADALWLPLRARTAARERLAGLARVPKPPEAVERAAGGGGPRAWRYGGQDDDTENEPSW